MATAHRQEQKIASGSGLGGVMTRIMVLHRLAGSGRHRAQLLGVLGLLALLAGCGASREARASLKAGQRAMAQRAFREALEHFRTSTAQAPGSAAAHLGRGEAAEVPVPPERWARAAASGPARAR